MNWDAWCTDTMDVWRITPSKDGSLTIHNRELVQADIPCRIYQTDSRAIQMQQTAADSRQEDKVACAVDWDVQAGDELLIHRGKRQGREVLQIRAFAAEPNYYFEPVGSVISGLSHQEIRLLQQERVK